MISKKHKIERVLLHLKRNRLMALGTVVGGTPWGATVFYAFDRALNLFFYSREDTKHCRNIKKNPRVSVIINHAWKDPDGSIKGLQITGRAQKVLKKDYDRYYRLYKARFRWADEFAADHMLYRITPGEIWYIDEKFFGHFFRVRVI